LNNICGPWFFWVYLLIVVAAAFLLNKFFMNIAKVKQWSASAQKTVLKYL